MLRKMRATTGWIFFEIFFTKYRNSCYATWAQIASTTVQDILDQYPNIKDSEQSIQGSICSLLSHKTTSFKDYQKKHFNPALTLKEKRNS